MLISFRVANFRSFKDEQELSLVRSSRLGGERRGSAGSTWDARFSPVAAIYGSNASGKSNLLLALKFMSDAIRESHARWSPEGGTPVEPFLLDAVHPAQPSRFEVEAIHAGTRVQYGFELDVHRIRQEWLYAYPNGRRQTWFERSTDADSPSEDWYFGKGLAGHNRMISELTRPNSLFISAAAASSHKVLGALSRDLTSRIRFADPDNADARTQFTMFELERRPDIAQRLQQLLTSADLGIRAVQVTRKEWTAVDQDRFLEVVRALSDKETFDQNQPMLRDLLQEGPPRFELLHATADGSPPTPLPYESESVGTRSLVALAGPALHVLDHGGVLLVDELDSSLHPRLVAEIVQLFQSAESNPNQAQLIFSSHDTSLLGHMAVDQPTLERDQVWFVQKDPDGSSQLYPLTDFSPRKMENLERGYLQGRYGAVPFTDLATELAVPRLRPASGGDE
ncbi:MAG: AAA family ATPase [Kribbellaceae bacterium]|nr:AAA family ATPase [Kribbellaceae bacterium]